MTRLLTLAAALLLGTAALAQDAAIGDLQILHPSIPAPFTGARSAGGYMAIVNNGTEADRLIGASAGFAKMTQVHESKIDANGVGTMAHIEALEIPAGETVLLERGGYHVMFMGLKETPAEGDKVPVTLIFEKAGSVELDFAVGPAGMAGMAPTN